VCGGCALIEQPYAEQLLRKQRAVRAALGRFPALAELLAPSGPLQPVMGSPAVTAYRTRAKLVIGESPAPGGGLQIGLYRPRTHDLLDVPDCAVLPEGTRRLLGLLRARLEGTRGLWRPLRHLVVRWSFFEGRAHLILVASARHALKGGGTWRREIKALCAELVRDPHARLAGAALSLQADGGGDDEGQTPIQVLGQRIEPLTGEQFLVESLGALRFRLSPGAFFQSNLAQAERIVALCDGWLGPPAGDGAATAAAGPRGTLVDLYAGVAPLGIALARHFERVLAVEAHPEASTDARQSAKLNDVPHLEVVAGLAENRAPHLGHEVARARAVLLNPPRRGCKPEVLRAAADLRPERMVYVSCDPETLARDLDRLFQLGYRAARVQPLDMFPQTDHVESVALLERLPPVVSGGELAAAGSPVTAPAAATSTPAAAARLVVVYEDEDLIALNKPPHLPVHGGTGHEDSLLARVASWVGPSAADGAGPARPVPLSRLDAGASGVVLIARRPSLEGAYARLVSAGAVDRRLIVLCRGHLRARGVINRELVDRRSGRRQRAVTRYQKIGLCGGHSLAELQMITSGPHQARRHLASIGHPVAGDARHGDWRTNRYFEEALTLNRPFMHVARLALPHPRTGRYLSIEAPLSGDLELVLARLRARDTQAGDPVGDG
jgi:23S rRNA (uracil1939-C5)-methyltransferase